MQSTPAKLAHSVNNAAAIIGAGRDGVYEAIRLGRLRARKFGRRTLILDEDLIEFLRSPPKLDLSTTYSSKLPRMNERGEP